MFLELPLFGFPLLELFKLVYRGEAKSVIWVLLMDSFLILYVSNNYNALFTSIYVISTSLTLTKCLFR